MAERPPTTSASSAAPAAGRFHRISLIKGDERWIFQWDAGNEATLISHVADLARDPRKPFDWLDAAAICRQIARAPGAASPAP